MFNISVIFAAIVSIVLADRIEDNFLVFCFSVLMNVMPVDKAVPVVDSIQCRLKLLLKELLSRVS